MMTFVFYTAICVLFLLAAAGLVVAFKDNRPLARMFSGSAPTSTGARKLNGISSLRHVFQTILILIGVFHLAVGIGLWVVYFDTSGSWMIAVMGTVMGVFYAAISQIDRLSGYAIRRISA